MATPLFAVRIDTTLHPIMRQIAEALRSDPSLADRLTEALTPVNTDNRNATIDNSPDNSEITELKSALDQLSTRLKRLEARNPRQNETSTLTLTTAEHAALKAAVDAHPRGATGFAASAGVSRAAVRRALAGSPLSKSIGSRLLRLLSTDH